MGAELKADKILFFLLQEFLSYVSSKKRLRAQATHDGKIVFDSDHWPSNCGSVAANRLA